MNFLPLRSWGQGQGRCKVKYFGELLWRVEEASTVTVGHRSIYHQVNICSAEICRIQTAVISSHLIFQLTLLGYTICGFTTIVTCGLPFFVSVLLLKQDSYYNNDNNLTLM